MQDQDALKQLNTIHFSNFFVKYIIFTIGISQHTSIATTNIDIKMAMFQNNINIHVKTRQFFLTIAEIPISGADFNDIHTTQPFSK